MATRSGYARTVRLWRRGTNVAEAPVLFETTPENMAAWGRRRSHAGAGERSGSSTSSASSTRSWIGDRTGPKVKLDLPTDIWIESIAAGSRSSARTPGRSAAGPMRPTRCSASRCRPSWPASRDFTVLFEPGERRALQGFFWCDGRLVLSILDELQPVFEVLTPSARRLGAHEAAGLPEIGVVNVWPLDIEAAESNGDLLAKAQDPVTPASLMLIEPRQGARPAEAGAADFRADGLVVTRHEAVSIDGERIPYVQVGPPAKPATRRCT